MCIIGKAENHITYRKIWYKENKIEVNQPVNDRIVEFFYV